MIQHDCRTARLWGSAVELQLNQDTAQLRGGPLQRTALLGSARVRSSPLCLCRPCCSAEPPSVFQLQPGNTILVAQREGKVRSPNHRVAYLFRQKHLPPVPDWSVLVQMKIPNRHGLMGTSSTVLIGQNGVAPSVSIAPIGWKKTQSYWLKYDSGTPL